MSMDSNTEPTSDESRTVVITVDAEVANQILASFEVPFPDASELDEIRLVIHDSAITITGNWQNVPNG